MGYQHYLKIRLCESNAKMKDFTLEYLRAEYFCQVALIYSRIIAMYYARLECWIKAQSTFISWMREYSVVSYKAVLHISL